MGGVYRIQTFFGFLYFFYIYKAPKATIFLFLGLRISWPEKRVGRSEKKKNQNN